MNCDDGDTGGGDGEASTDDGCNCGSMGGEPGDCGSNGPGDNSSADESGAE